MLKESSAILKESILKKDMSFLALTLSLLLLPLSINLSTFTLILSIVFKLIQVALKRDQLFATKALKHSAIIGLCFFIYIEINSILQSDLYHNFLYFEKQYMHFALLFISPILLRSKKENKILIYALFLGVAIAVLYVFFYAIIHNMTFDKKAFENQIDLHHTYLSMFILTFVNYCVVQKIIRKTNTNNALTVLYIFLAALSLGIIYVLDSKVSIFIFLFLFANTPNVGRHKPPSTIKPLNHLAVSPYLRLFQYIPGMIGEQLYRGDKLIGRVGAPLPGRDHR